MRRIRNGLVAVLMLCIALRICAWLISPAIPFVAVFLFLLTLLIVIAGRHRDL